MGSNNNNFNDKESQDIVGRLTEFLDQPKNKSEFQEFEERTEIFFSAHINNFLSLHFETAKKQKEIIFNIAKDILLR